MQNLKEWKGVWRTHIFKFYLYYFVF